MRCPREKSSGLCKSAAACPCPGRRRNPRARYAVRKERMPYSNFPRVRGPGQYYAPGSTPQVSTGTTNFLTGVASAFQPVLQAASNYLNQVTKSVEIRNKMAMAAPGAGSSVAGSNSNSSSIGSINGTISQAQAQSQQNIPVSMTVVNNLDQGGGPAILQPEQANFAVNAITTRQQGTQTMREDPFDTGSTTVSPTPTNVAQTPSNVSTQIVQDTVRKGPPRAAKNLNRAPSPFPG